MALDAEIRSLLKELGAALNESISSSAKVNEVLGRIRAIDYEVYLILNATVAIEKLGERRSATLPSIRRGAPPQKSDRDSPAFQINVKDLNFLKTVGIDPTRSVRSRRPSPDLTFRSSVYRRP